MKLRVKAIFTGLFVFFLSWVLIGILLTIPGVLGFYETLEAYIYFRLFSSTAIPSDDIVIIDESDEKYDRDSYAELIHKLDHAGAKIIALDVLFSNEKHMKQNIKLLEATQNANAKVIHGVEFVELLNSPNPFPDFFIKTKLKEIPANFIDAKGALLPFPALRAVTRYFAHINRTIDETLKEAQYYPLIIKYNNRLYPSLPLVAVAEYLDSEIYLNASHDIELLATNKNESDSIKASIPVNIRGQTLINFLKRDDFAGKLFTFRNILEKFDEATFRDKIVLIGSSFDSQEQWLGPHSEYYPSLIVIGSVISQIMGDKYIRYGIIEGIVLSIILSVIVIIITFELSGWFEFKFPHQRVRFFILFYFLCFPMFLVVALIFLHFEIKIPVIIPYLVFIITTSVTRWYYNYRRKLTFVSYSREDENFVKKLAASLENYGLELWLFQASLKPGDKWREMVHAAIHNSKAFIIILSKKALDSQYIQFERLTAKMYNKSICPVLFETCEIPTDLDGIEYSDFRNTNDFDAKVEELAHVLLKKNSKKKILD